MNKLLYLFFIVFIGGCGSESETEKYQKKRDNIIDVRKQVKEIVIEDVLIGRVARPFLIDNYLVIGDYTSIDKLIHIFNKKNYDYLTSVASVGQGPNEITNMGHIGIDEIHHKFYVSDHGKQKIFSYDIDSVVVDSFYIPKVKMKMNEGKFPDRYLYVNDSLCIGLIIEPIGSNNFKPSVAKWNMNTGEIVLMKYEHPNIKKKRISFTASIENGIYVECHNYHDLITICSLNGNLKYNIYGPNWSDEKSKTSYYREAVFCKDKILVSYSGEDTFSKDRIGGMKLNNPTKFLVFDLEGNYIKTLETGYQIYEYCYDRENNRIIMILDDEIQIAYLDLDEIIG